MLASASSACFLNSSSDRPDDSRSGFHDVTVRWHIRNVDNTVMASCPAGFTTLVTHLYNSGFVEPPDALIKTPCTPEGSLTQPVATAGDLIDETTRDQLVHGYYPYTPQKDIWVDVTEETQTSFAAVSYTYFVDKLAADTTIDFDLYPGGGVGVAAWSLRSSLTSAPLSSCAAAGVDQIEAAVRPFADDTAPLVVAGTWPCGQIDPYFHYDPDGNSTLPGDQFQLGTGHTRALAPGSYFVEMRAKRGGAIVGRSVEASFEAQTMNSAHRIHGADVVIQDR